jgi:hypothetical protein
VVEGLDIPAVFTAPAPRVHENCEFRVLLICRLCRSIIVLLGNLKITVCPGETVSLLMALIRTVCLLKLANLWVRTFKFFGRTAIVSRFVGGGERRGGESCYMYIEKISTS